MLRAEKEKRDARPSQFENATILMSFSVAPLCDSRGPRGSSQSAYKEVGGAYYTARGINSDSRAKSSTEADELVATVLPSLGQGARKSARRDAPPARPPLAQRGGPPAAHYATKEASSARTQVEAGPPLAW